MSIRRSAVAVLACALFVVACIAKDDGKRAQQDRTVVAGQLSPKGMVPPPPVPRKGLVYVGDEKLLPKHKTEWERQIERLMGAGKAGGSPYAAWFDDYRKNNIDSFFITKPPTTTAFRAPAEYEESQAMLVTWAQLNDPAANLMSGTIVKGAWGVVPVLMLHQNAAHKTWIEGRLTAMGYTAAEIQDPKNIIWWEHPTNVLWTRDYGPLSIVSTDTTPGTLSFVDFRYYPTRPAADVVPSALASEWGINVFRPDLDLEGSNFMTTSEGLCAQSNLTVLQNPQLAKSAIEDIFKQHLACKKFIWTPVLPAPHIDMYAKFASDTAVLVGEYTAAQGAYDKIILDTTANMFASTTTPSGQTLTVTRIPMPDKAGRAPSWSIRSYTASVTLKGPTQKVVLVPVYAQEASKEAAAMAAYAAAFPGWTIVKVTSDTLVSLEGAIHSLTMQIPVGTKAKMEADPADLCGLQQLYCASGPCGNVTAAGCCQGETLKYCNSAGALAPKLVSEDCTGKPSCGWDSTGNWYQCGTAGDPDPSGTNAKSCDVVTDAATAAPCGTVTWEGCCDAQTLYYCENGELKILDCMQAPNKLSCGWSEAYSFYSCNTAGGADPDGTHPKNCAFGDAGPPPKPDAAPGCGTITHQGCCENTVLKYCADNVLKTVDCSGNPGCGWNATNKFYDCATEGNPEPSGAFPKACSETPADAAVDLPPPDLAVPDAPVVDKAVPQPDAPAKTDAAPVDKDDDDGCSCRIATGSRRSAHLLLVLGLALCLVVVRRRGRQGGRGR